LLSYYGPTLNVDIGFDKNWIATIPSSVRIPSIKSVKALVDTGPMESCIDDMLAVQLNLPVIDEIQMSGAGGTMTAKM
jgi:hypothetical protein